MNALLILGIDTSAKIASCALTQDGVLLAERTVMTQLTHSQILMPMITSLLEDAEIKLADIDGFCAACGPGSYTGLRIGIAAIKGLCMGLDKKCAGISTLEALAYNCLCFDGDIFAVMNARRDIAYFGHYNSNGNKLSQVESDTVCPIDRLKSSAEKCSGSIMLVGDYAHQLKEELFSDNESVLCANKTQCLQRAAMVNLASMSKSFESADKLDAIYLQATKAEKDKKYKN